MKKFNFAPAVGFCFLLCLSCSFNPLDTSDSSQPFFTGFDVETFNRERAAWEAQGIANYSFVEKNEYPAQPPRNYIGRVTVTGNTISDIEIQRMGMNWNIDIQEGNWNEVGEFTEFVDGVPKVILDNIDTAKDTVNGFGNIGSIYDRILSAHQDIYSAYQEMAAFLSTEQYEGLYLSSDIRYNEQYHYPEYALIRVNKGVDFWIVGLLPNFNIELSDFQILEKLPRLTDGAGLKQ